MRKNKFSVIRLFLSLTGIMLLSVILFFGSAYFWPVSRNSFLTKAPLSYRIKDRQGRLIREAVGSTGEKAQYIEFSKLSKPVMQSTLAIEDRKFYSHNGVEYSSMVRAFWQNISSGKNISGASTITMQLARILTDSPRNIPGKFVQIWSALQLERVFSKDEILEMYLNRIPYGNGAIGIESASRTYFDKPSSHLNLSEAALLAGIPQAPGLLNPFKNPGFCEKRRLQVLKALSENSYPDKEEINRAIAEQPVVIQKPSRIVSGHFTDYVLSLDPEPGDINTALDGDLNEIIQEMVTLHVEQYRDKGLTNASVIMLHNPTGEIRVLIGSRGWNDPEDGAVNGATSRRQPGSALKPFAYELALERGVKPNIVLADVETEYYGTDRTLYIPQNYSQTFRGPVIFQEALALSLNIPAIRLISEHVGLDLFLKRLKDLGFEGLKENKDYYGLGLVLGNGEVSALELAGAYSVLARNGIYIKPTPFPAEKETEGKRIMDDKASALITAILSDETLRIQAFGIANPLLFGLPLAVKTGTSNQWRDTWTAGYTEEFTLVVWAGNFNADPMDGLSGAMGAGILFSKIIKLLSKREPKFFRLPPMRDDLKKVPLCTWSGYLPNENCSKTAVIYTYDEKITDICKVHKTVSIDKNTGLLSDEGALQKDQKKVPVSDLPPVYDGWLKEKGFLKPPSSNTPGSQNLIIQKPREGDRYIIEPGYNLKTQSIEFQLIAHNRPEEIIWYLNGQKVAVKKWPYSYTWPLVKGTHTLRAGYSNQKSNKIHFVVR